ncbi:MAG: GntR family transcriptional regulator [Eubacterium sp.]
MLIFINNKNGVPIYDQIYSQIKAQIINGTLEEDTPLPSIRSLAKDLHISVITTKRAYEELERDGFIYTAPGKGSFVAARNTELLREENLKQIEEHLEKIIELAAMCNLDKNSIISMLNILFEEE